mmetsp:Transcript_19763/g.39378  ORF Transcript_19763/g.39378 Transcript_19763/m.39378 type:complete len:117 (-) Transcript_19763:357-707(-)
MTDGGVNQETVAFGRWCLDRGVGRGGVVRTGAWGAVARAVTDDAKAAAAADREKGGGGKGKNKRGLRAAFKSKRAGDDVKRKGQKFEPYACVPLNGKSYTKKHRADTVDQIASRRS